MYFYEEFIGNKLQFRTHTKNHGALVIGWCLLQSSLLDFLEDTQRNQLTKSRAIKKFMGVVVVIEAYDFLGSFGFCKRCMKS